MAGDFNIDIAKNSLASSRFLNLMVSFGLKPTVDSYTREFQGSKSIIDNIFTNFPSNDVNCDVLVTAMSDHHAQFLKIKADIRHQQQPRFRWKRCFSDENVRYFNFLLKHETWHDITSSDDINDMADCFLNTMDYNFNMAFPLKRTKILESHSKGRIILTPELISLRERSRQLYTLSKDSDFSSKERIEYRRAKQLFRSKIREAKTTELARRIERADNVSKVVWSIVKEGRPSAFASPFQNLEVNDEHGVITKDPNAVSSLFNDYFTSVAERLLPPSSDPATVPSLPCGRSLTNSFALTPVCEAEVEDIIDSLRTKSSAGFDGISSKLLKTCSVILSKPLAIILNKSFESGCFPNALKKSIIKPMHKKGSTKELDNYRPIALISTFSKVFEKAFTTRLLEFFTSFGVIFKHQFGFLKNRSTTHAMFHLINQIVSALDKGQSAAGVFLDLSKAFDLVNHHVLLQKLNQVGVRGVPADWIHSYLSERQQCVEIPFISKSVLQISRSDFKHMAWGVPQGSIIGPLLFLVFINDASTSVSKGNVSLFADDTAVAFCEPSKPLLEQSIFSEINNLLQWLTSNKLRVNADKTSLIEFSIQNRNETGLACLLGESEVYSVDSTKYLGLVIDKNLRFSKHVDKVSRSVSAGIFVLRKLAAHLKIEHLLNIYYGIIYPHLLYALPLWGFSSSRVNHLFVLQKRAIRTIFHFNSREHCREVFRSYKLLTLPSIYILETLTFVKKTLIFFQ